MKSSVPARFPGSESERQKNRDGHRFGSEGRCFDCDCRPWGISAEWPCGASVPRVEVSLEEAKVAAGMLFLGAGLAA